MPRMTFSSDNKINKRDDFPKLKIDGNVGDKARIWCPEEPIAEYVHNLRMPKLDHNGRQAFKIVKDKDGNEKEVPDYDFVSRPLCLGEVSVLEEDGLDPKRCPACREARKNEAIDGPVRRFAMHVVRYSTKNDGTPTKPFQANVYVWSFTDFMFDKLVDIANEFDGLDKIDLILTLKTKQYQQYDLMGSPNTLRADAKVAALLDEVFAENQAKELSAFCGMTKKADQIAMDIEKIKTRWDLVLGRSAPSLEPANSTVLSEGLDDLLSGSDSSPAPAAEKKDEPAKSQGGEEVNFDDLFS